MKIQNKVLFQVAGMIFLIMSQSNSYAAAVVLMPSTISQVMAQYTQPINMAGLRDSTFGIQGLVTTDVRPGSESRAYSCAQQSDGKIISAGFSSNGVNKVFTIIRYTTSGVLDPSFGNEGVVTTNITPTHDSQANSCAIQSDGKIIAAGYGTVGAQLVFAVARYNSDGSLDTTFGNQGIMTTDLNPGHNSEARACALQSDGKIIVVGYMNDGVFDIFATVRYTADGILDNTFNGGGTATINVFPGGYSQGNSCVVQPDGKILVVGGAFSDNLVALVRYNTDGTFDQSFGDGGVVTTDAMNGLGGSVARSCALQSDGKIVAAGYGSNGAHAVFVVVCYLANGSVDQTFGNAGVVITDVLPGQASEAVCCVVQLDGRIIVAGSGDGAVSRICIVVRYLTNGSLDQSFGNQGVILTAATPGPGNDSRINGCVLQSNGEIVATGFASGANFFFATLRYINPFTLPSFTASYGGVGLV